MPLKSFSMLQYAVLLFQFYISSGTECHGESQPCKCFIGKYECRNLSKQKCNWQSDISKCIDVDIDAEETTTDFPSYHPTDQPTPVPISSIHHTLNQETQQHEYHEYQNGEQHHLYIPETKKTTTDFPSFQPTEDPTSNTESDYPIIECGDTINGHYQHKDIIFEIDLLYDTQSIEINACNSNYDTTLELFDGLDEDAPQYSDDNTCNNQYDSSLIEIENGLSAGTYYLLLSANNAKHHQHGNYELHLFCQTESEIQHDKITSFTNKNNDINEPNTQTECNSNCDAFTIQMIYYGPLSYYNTDDIYYDFIDVNSDTNNRRLQTASETETKINYFGKTTKKKSKANDNAKMGFFNPKYVYYDDTNNDDVSRRRGQAIPEIRLSPASILLTAKRHWKMEGDRENANYNMYGDYGYGHYYNYDEDYDFRYRNRNRNRLKYKNTNLNPRRMSDMSANLMDNNNIDDVNDVNDVNDTNDNIMCYTYRVERLFDDGICTDSINSIVLGACDMDYNKINYKDLDDLIVKEYGGDLYQGYNSLGINEITGIKINVPVNDNIEFTLCMHGVNDKGNVSHLVQFDRGVKSAYLCHDQSNDGLPCLSRSYNGNGKTDASSDVPIVRKTHKTSSPAFSHILQGILLIALSVMVMISALYIFISTKAKKSIVKKQNTEIDWAEINVSDTLSDTEDNDANDERDPLDLEEDIVYNKILSPASQHNNENRKLLNRPTKVLNEAEMDGHSENDKIADLKENLFDLNRRFLNNQNNQNNNNNRSERSSVSSNISENDGCTILSVYNDYTVTDDGYYNDAYSNDDTTKQ